MNQHIKAPNFVSFITSPAGRTLRVIVGLILISIGMRAATLGGYILAVIGLIPLLAGAFDFCILGPVLGGPFNGKAMRTELHNQQGHPEFGNKPHTWMKA